MPKTYNIFISHSWSYSNAYDALILLLNRRSYFNFKDYSVPRDDPIHTQGTNRELMNAIISQMSPCHIILIMAGMYAHYSKWIKKELHIANSLFPNPKPIIAIKPWAQERTSNIVKEYADAIVSWNTESIISAIRKYAL